MGNQRSRPFELFVNLLRDFTLLLFVIDIHQIMLVSLFMTSFDHFHFHPTLALKSRGYIVKPSYNIIEKIRLFSIRKSRTTF